MPVLLAHRTQTGLHQRCRHGIGWAVGGIVHRDGVQALMEDQG
jgi:hypothetical protein